MNLRNILYSSSIFSLAAYSIKIAVPRRYRAFFMVYNQFFYDVQKIEDLFLTLDLPECSRWA